MLRATLTFTFEPAFGCCHFLPMFASAAVIILINAYLYYCTVQEIVQEYGGNQQKTSRIKRILHNIHLQLDPSMSLLILDGIDVILNVSKLFVLAIQ